MRGALAPLESVVSLETVFAPVRSQTAFEETVERSLLRALFGAMQDHPIILASKRPPDEPLAGLEGSLNRRLFLA